MWGKEVVLILFGVLGLDVVLGGALCFGFRVVLWIIVWDLGGASDFVFGTFAKCNFGAPR